MKYKKKPVVIEAFHLGVDRFWPEWFHQAVTDNVIITHAEPNAGRKAPIKSASIKTLEGVMTADFGDYIIRGVKGEIYPCKPDIFQMTYEKVE